jgi:DNA-binding NtrC family response regulator
MSLSRSASSCLGFPPPDAVRAAAAERGFEIVGSSAVMKRLRLQVRLIGPHFRSVLVSGEAGTGKELVALALHRMSPGADGPFVVCPAAGLEEALAECEASAGSADVFSPLLKTSRRGTLFLDGISEVPLEAQGRLLRMLEKHESAQCRQEAAKRLDLRLIATTCEDLRVSVSTGRFRQGLYQRIATVEIALPPLRDRVEDLPELAKCFLGRFALPNGKRVDEISDEAMERMRRYRWPGNLLELESVLRNGVLQSEGATLEAHHLPVLAMANGPEHSTMEDGGGVRLQDVVQRHVLRVLKDCGGNKLRAAEVLGISRSTLYRMLDAGASAVSLR